MPLGKLPDHAARGGIPDPGGAVPAGADDAGMIWIGGKDGENGIGVIFEDPAPQDPHLTIVGNAPKP